MNLNNLIILCRRYSAMGDAVCDQICDVVMNYLTVFGVVPKHRLQRTIEGKPWDEN